MTILNRIVAHKRDEVSSKKNQISQRQLERSEFFNSPRKPFADAIRNAPKAAVIAEFKRRSPSKGAINNRVSIEEVARGYASAGASALSILTDAEFFGGSNADLETAYKTVQIPILRKDFIVDEYQIVEARAIGASAILLIAAALEESEIQKLARFARSLELEVLLEVHDEREIPHDFEHINAIGFNNRNLHNFSVDVGRSLEIASKLPSNAVKISESGINAPATIRALAHAGFKGFLIGETFMKTANPAAACADFVKQLQTFDFTAKDATNG